MACRDMERGEAAREEIVEDSGNQNVVLKKLDLSNTKSIREFAEFINKGMHLPNLKLKTIKHFNLNRGLFTT